MMTPYEYQQKALDIIEKIINQKRSFLLAFDKGLGKTIVTLIFITNIIGKNKASRFLLIVNGNNINDPWKKELDNIFRNISYMIYHNTTKKTHFDYNEKKERIDIGDKNIIITTYNTFKNDFRYFDLSLFSVIIFDEFHNYYNGNNDKLKIFNFLKKETMGYPKLVLTGSPIKNTKKDLEVIRDFINDDKENRNDDNIFVLSKESQAQLLRLPKKEEYNIFLPTHQKIKEEYERIIKLKGKNKYNIISPFLSIPKKIRSTKAYQELSYKAKFALIIAKHVDSNRQKLIIYSSYAHTLNALSLLLTEKNIKHAKYTGKQTMVKRDKRLELFKKSKDLNTILISTKAGGEGLNIQEANHIVIFEPWWNPQRIIQSIDRAYRAGQKKTVIVFNLFYKEDQKVIDNMSIKEEISDNFFEKKQTMRKEVSFAESDFEQDSAKINKFLDEINIEENQDSNDVEEKAELEMKKVQINDLIFYCRLQYILQQDNSNPTTVEETVESEHDCDKPGYFMPIQIPGSDKSIDI
jgi:SNF2 family DNA or RNA helicase